MVLVGGISFSSSRRQPTTRTKATGHGGIGAIAKLIGNVGLAGEIDSSLELLKLHKPYHESDHV